MNDDLDQAARPDTIRIFETGIRVALEEMLTGRNYARVEDILRALADGSSIPTPRSATPQQDATGLGGEAD